jgi:hypothetical protein
MTERETLTLESLTLIRAVLALLNQITPGYGVTPEELKGVKNQLLELTTRISNSLEIEENGAS